MEWAAAWHGAEGRLHADRRTIEYCGRGHHSADACCVRTACSVGEWRRRGRAERADGDAEGDEEEKGEQGHAIALSTPFVPVRKSKSKSETQVEAMRSRSRRAVPLFYYEAEVVATRLFQQEMGTAVQHGESRADAVEEEGEARGGGGREDDNREDEEEEEREEEDNDLDDDGDEEREDDDSDEMQDSDDDDDDDEDEDGAGEQGTAQHPLARDVPWRARVRQLTHAQLMAAHRGGSVNAEEEEENEDDDEAGQEEWDRGDRREHQDGVEHASGGGGGGASALDDNARDEEMTDDVAMATGSLLSLPVHSAGSRTHQRPHHHRQVAQLTRRSLRGAHVASSSSSSSSASSASSSATVIAMSLLARPHTNGGGASIPARGHERGGGRGRGGREWQPTEEVECVHSRRRRVNHRISIGLLTLLGVEESGGGRHGADPSMELGHDACSVALEGKTGAVRCHGRPVRAANARARFGVGDTVGCGVLLDARTLFWTVNGRLVARVKAADLPSFQSECDPDEDTDDALDWDAWLSRLFPALSLHEPGECVRATFPSWAAHAPGEIRQRARFRFDLDSFRKKELRQRQQALVAYTSMWNADSDPAPALNGGFASAFPVAFPAPAPVLTAHHEYPRDSRPMQSSRQRTRRNGDRDRINGKNKKHGDTVTSGDNDMAMEDADMEHEPRGEFHGDGDSDCGEDVVLHALVRDYFEYYGYGSALAALDAATSLSDEGMANHENGIFGDENEKKKVEIQHDDAAHEEEGKQEEEPDNGVSDMNVARDASYIPESIRFRHELRKTVYAFRTEEAMAKLHQRRTFWRWLQKNDPLLVAHCRMLCVVDVLRNGDDSSTRSNGNGATRKDSTTLMTKDTARDSVNDGGWHVVGAIAAAQRHLGDYLDEEKNQASIQIQGDAQAVEQGAGHESQVVEVTGLVQTHVRQFMSTLVYPSVDLLPTKSPGYFFLTWRFRERVMDSLNVRLLSHSTEATNYPRSQERSDDVTHKGVNGDADSADDAGTVSAEKRPRADPSCCALQIFVDDMTTLQRQCITSGAPLYPTRGETSSAQNTAARRKSMKKKRKQERQRQFAHRRHYSRFQLQRQRDEALEDDESTLPVAFSRSGQQHPGPHLQLRRSGSDDTMQEE